MKSNPSSPEGKQSRMVQTFSSLEQNQENTILKLLAFHIWKYFENHSILFQIKRWDKMGISLVLEKINVVLLLLSLPDPRIRIAFQTTEICLCSGLFAVKTSASCIPCM